jgi:hypothetical protein
MKQILYFFAAFLFISILFELLLKWGGIMNPILTIHPENGERYLPNKMCCSLFNYEGFGLAKTNSAGWFGNDPTHRDAAATHVAVLGNSFIAARQIFARHHFLNILENKLQKAGKNIRFYNFGKETMPLCESLYIKEEIDSLYHPDYFVVFINMRSLGNEGRYIPYYELQNDSLVLNEDFKNEPFVKQYDQFSLLSQSSLLFLIYRVKNNIGNWGQIVLDKLYWEKSLAEKDESRSVDEADVAVIKAFSKDPRVIFLIDIDQAREQTIRHYSAPSPLINVQPALVTLHKKTGINPYAWPITEQIGHWNYSAHRQIAQELFNQFEKGKINAAK